MFFCKKMRKYLCSSKKMCNFVPNFCLTHKFRRKKLSHLCLMAPVIVVVE